MKAVKIKMSESSSSKSIKALIFGVIINIAICLIITLILSIFLVVAGNLFESAAKYIMLIPLMSGGYLGGYTTASINKANGLLFGVLSGIAVILLMLIIGFATGISDITYMILLKVLAVLLPSAIGGIKGVNKKEKLKI